MARIIWNFPFSNVNSCPLNLFFPEYNKLLPRYQCFQFFWSLTNQEMQYLAVQSDAVFWYKNSEIFKEWRILTLRLLVSEVDFVAIPISIILPDRGLILVQRVLSTKKITNGVIFSYWRSIITEVSEMNRLLRCYSFGTTQVFDF